MSSLFVRPESPPPRIPSPPPTVFTALASPCSRSHRKPSSSSSAPSLPPSLQHDRTLLTVRSYEHFSHKHDLPSHRQPKRARSALTHSACSSRTNSLPEPFTPPIAPRPRHRTLSLAPRISPPPSPQIRTPPPPVPSVPAFILTPAVKSSSPNSDQPSVTDVYLSELESVSSISDSVSTIRSKKPLLGKTRSAGMTCLKFFALRNSLKND